MVVVGGVVVFIVGVLLFCVGGISVVGGWLCFYY